ncbi:MAG: single-stranded DNA-binding protein [Thermonemataceae bacterium]|nr:single-stranded DNA-binding protein [Thermonemataceae bacterium]
MRSLNKVTLIGHLGKNPVWKVLKGGISVATTESYRDKAGALQTETEWHSVVAWRNLADLANKYLQKDSHIYLEGKIKSRFYEDKDGVKRYLTEIVAESFIMLDKRTDKAEINASF